MCTKTEIERKNGLEEKDDRLVLRPDNFKQMVLHGQFNQGYIAASHRDELYLFDQHACDEKYRFEDLIQNQKVSYQQCITPIKMRLTPSRESLVA